MEPTPLDALRRQLLDFTRCAACGAPLAATRCARCGLEMAGDDGVRIADASRVVARALDARRDVIDAARARQGAGAGARQGEHAGAPR
ncbi:hypothetical protein, partial [Cellulomonas sp. PS-H5]|uniref:hypothetical protein n=1 Tax=Cellulomonas sp. PS-H5 TaxID=2820400 RepID=UPI001C4EE599